MMSNDNIRPRTDGRPSDISLFPGKILPVFAAPMETGYDNLTACFPQFPYIRRDILFPVLIRETVPGHADPDAIFLKNAQLTVAGDYQAGSLKIGNGILPTLFAIVKGVVVGHIHRLNTAAGQDLRVFRRTFEIKLLLFLGRFLGKCPFKIDQGQVICSKQ